MAPRPQFALLWARPLASAHLLGCFQLLGVEFVDDFGFGADVIVAFVGHKADVGVIRGLWRTFKTIKSGNKSKCLEQTPTW